MANEKRLIDANEIYELFYKQVEYGATDLMDAFEDAVEVVRCKDCKHLGFKGLCDGVCNRKMVGIVNPDDFCSYGERREGE